MDTQQFDISLRLNYRYDEHSKDSYFINETYELTGNLLKHGKEERGRKRSPKQTRERVLEAELIQKIIKLIQSEELYQKPDYNGEIAKDATTCSIKLIATIAGKSYQITLSGEAEDVREQANYRPIMRIKNCLEE